MYYPSLSDNKYAFIDETGNFGFNFNLLGTSSHYIVTAIIVEKENVKNLRACIDLIRNKYFGPGEIKSSNVAKDHKRRIIILDELLKYKFNIFSLVVDKERIYDGSGLEFKKTFIKHLDNILYKELKLLYPHLMIIADCKGSDKFMKEFERYIYKTPNFCIFDDYGFEFKDSKTEPLIQLADFMSGTISFGFEKSKKCDIYKAYYNKLKDRIIAIKLWPLTFENYITNLNSINISEYDEEIALYCYRLTQKYIEEHKNSKDSTNIDEVRILEYLLNQLTIYNPSRYVSSKELITYLDKTNGNHYSSHTFKTNIIANLRDNNVIISSSANGYKLPISKKELLSYINKTLGMIMPMLSRLKKCRTRILALTNNELDILDSEEYRSIKMYFDEIQNKI